MNEIDISQPLPVHDPGRVASFREMCAENPMIPEEIIKGLYQAVLRREDTSIDCGAHKGYHTKPMLEICREGHTIAYEALPKLAKKLEKDLSPFHGLIVRSCAVQEDPDLENLTFQFVPKRPGRSGITSATINTLEDNKYDFEEIEVAASTIDKDLEGFGIAPESVAFIKLDLEGGEFGALRGASGALKIGRPVLAYENGRFAAETMGYTNEDFDQFMTSVGYVRISAFGEFLDCANFDFHYLFAAPLEKAEMVRRLISGLFAACYLRYNRVLPQ